MTASDNEPGDLLIGAPAIAKCLGVSQRQVYRLINGRHIPTFKLGGSLAARRSSLARFLSEIESAYSGVVSP